MASNAPPSLLNNIEIIIRKCIPKELIPVTWKCDKVKIKDDDNDFCLNVKSLFEQGQPKLGIFESGDVLLQHIGEYFNFSNGMSYLGLNPSYPIDYTPQQGQNLQQKTCVYKIDLKKGFPYLPGPLEGRTHIMAYMILDDCWIKMLAGTSHHEMIVCPYLLNVNTVTYPKYPAFSKPVPYGKILGREKENWQKKWKERWVEQIYEMSDFILESMEKLSEKKIGNVKFEDRPGELTEAIEYVAYIMEKIKEFAKAGDIDLPPLNKLKKTTPIIRLFPVGKYHYVMANEFLKICEDQKIDVKKLKKKVRGKTELTTFLWNDIESMWKNKETAMMDAERLLMFAQTPIPIYERGYCILASDALHELLMDMIVAKKVFETNGEENWIKINEFFESLELYFDPNENVCFLNLQHLDVIKTMWEYVYLHHLKNSVSEKELIEEPGDTNFSLEDLKTKLKSLSFDNILKYAQPIYSKLTAKEGLSSSALHLAEAFCQINILARKVPNILKFIHNQKSCDRMNIVDCEHCEKEKETEKMVKDMDKMRISEEKQEDFANVPKPSNKKNRKN